MIFFPTIILIFSTFSRSLSKPGEFLGGLADKRGSFRQMCLGEAVELVAPGRAGPPAGAVPLPQVAADRPARQARLPGDLPDRLPDGGERTWAPLSTTLVYGSVDAVLVDPPLTTRQATADRFLRRALRRGWLRGDGLWPRGWRYIAALRGFLRARHYLT